MEIDEVSLVDRPANPHAAITIAKAFEGDPMADEYFRQDGSSVTLNEFGIPDDAEKGEIFYNAAGAAFDIPDEVWAEFEAAQGDEGDEPAADERELAGAGVSKAFGRTPVQKSLVDEVRETLSKASTDKDTRAVLSKALDTIDELSKKAEGAMTIAKAEADRRLTGEYTEVAKAYGQLPVKAEDLGPVLKRCADALSDEDCAVLHKCFTATGEIFKEFGLEGGGSEDGSDPMATVEAAIEAAQSKGQLVRKSADGTVEQLSKHEATVEYFAANPEMYDDYINSQRR